jgi:transcription initiation factor IIF auxiliary subunit
MQDQSIEQRVFNESEKRDFEFYLNSVLESYADNTMLSVEISVDNKTLTEKLIKEQNKKNKKIRYKTEKITIGLIKKLIEEQPIIVHVDDNYLGDYSHASHYIVIESLRKDGKFEIIDPMDGKVKSLSEEKLVASIDSLKNHIKMCPIVIRKI